MLIEDIKIFSPVITFILGVLSVPLVETLKEKFRRKEDVRQLNAEFSDEICNLMTTISTMASHIHCLESLREIDAPGVKGPIKYIPIDIRVVFLDTVMEKSYRHLTGNQRRILKIMPTQIAAINDYCKVLSDIEVKPENVGQHIDYARKYIYTTCCLRYAMLSFLDLSKEHFCDDEGIINQQLQEVGVHKITFNDLVIRKKISVTENG